MYSHLAQPLQDESSLITARIKVHEIFITMMKLFGTKKYIDFGEVNNVQTMNFTFDCLQ